MNPSVDENLSLFTHKMDSEGLQPFVTDTFAHYYKKVASGETGLIKNSEIEPVSEEEIVDARTLTPYEPIGEIERKRAVKIVLNGGLGTSMGLTRAKSLIPVKGRHTFLDIILAVARAQNFHLALMNSYNTDRDTQKELVKTGATPLPTMFLQHKFPKILTHNLGPVDWPDNPQLEWNPPGHGDIYTALYTSGTLGRLLADGIDYAFICNSDNLGAKMNTALMGYFVDKKVPFMMEVAEKTPSDTKGGHLARYPDGRLLLREVAQCPEEERIAFQDISRFRYFNTNNIWVDLHRLKSIIESQGVIRLPVIINPKTVDPRDKTSPSVYQIETAMGSAISLFKGAIAVRVPRDRFAPVKTCADLLSVRSDRYQLSSQHGLNPNPSCRSKEIKIQLDPAYYQKIDQLEARFPNPPPSLLACQSLTIKGDVCFEENITLAGHVTIINQSSKQVSIKAGSTLEGLIEL